MSNSFNSLEIGIKVGFDMYRLKALFSSYKRNDIRNLCTTGYWPPKLLNTHQNYALSLKIRLHTSRYNRPTRPEYGHVLNPMFKFQCQEKHENSAYFSFIHFHMTKLKGPDDSKSQFQKVGEPSKKFYNKQLD